MRHLLPLLPAAYMLFTACVANPEALEPGGSCARAAEHIAACTGTEVAPPPDCTDADAARLLELSCGEIAAGQGKGDGILCLLLGLFCTPTCASEGGICAAGDGGDVCGDLLGTSALNSACDAAGAICCARPAGRDSGACLAGAEADASFVTDTTPYYYYSHEDHGETMSLRTIRLDGSNAEKVISTGYGLVSASDDLRVFAIEDANTNLYVATLDPATGATPTNRVDALDLIPNSSGVGDVRVAPDGSAIAFTVHPDFATPQSSWVDDNTVYILDPETREITHSYAGVMGDISMNLYFTNDSRTIVQNTGLHMRCETMDLACTDAGAGCRVPCEEPTFMMVGHEGQDVHPAMGQDGRTCDDTGERLACRRTDCVCADGGSWCSACEDDNEQCADGIWAVSDTSARQLVRLVGGHWDPSVFRPTISTKVWSPDCGAVLFTFRDALWITEVASGRVGPLASDGGGGFFLPAATPMSPAAPSAAP